MSKSKTKTIKSDMSLEDQLTDLELAINSKPNSDPLNLAIYLIVKQLFQMKQAESEKVESLQVEVESLKSKIIELENEKTKTQIRIQGLPIHKESKKTKKPEKTEQTKELLAGLFAEMDCSEIETKNVYRLQIEGNKNKDKPPLIVTFLNESDKSVFFKSLPNLKGIKKYNIRVENEYPKSLNNQLKKVKQLGYEMRQKGYITQIRYKQSELKLFRKKPGKKFVEFIE